ncbi:MAG TPA: hypothetical protein VHB20_03700 [Verrucomicrobiae bacterium]|jgi:hypothetical protein|nr:hypothetical protein [Verrucomicrobiae bacterium]
MTTKTFCSLLLAFCAASLHASGVIQIDVRAILTGRAVTTLSDGKLVPWDQGVDGGGRGDGYMTREASTANGDHNAQALPGDGVYEATATHPVVKLNFSNKDAKGFQTRGVLGAGSFGFDVPAGHYSRMMLFMTSAEGPSQLHFKLTYAGGVVEERDILLPDYYYDAAADDTNVFSLGKNLPKWDATGRMKERDHHYLHGVDVHPTVSKQLISIQVSKTGSAYLVFWGATGVSAD